MVLIPKTVGEMHKVFLYPYVKPFVYKSSASLTQEDTEGRLTRNPTKFSNIQLTTPALYERIRKGTGCLLQKAHWF